MDPSAVPQNAPLTSLAEVFTFLFIMIGPLKLIGPFVRATHELTDAQRSRFALEAALISTVSAILGGLAGRGLLEKWNVTVPALLLAAGLVFLLVALSLVMHQYDHTTAPAAAGPGPAPKPSSLQFSFPNVVTPYGIAAIITFMTTGGGARTPAVIGLIVAVMVLNLLAMTFARPILKYLGLPLQVLGAVLGVVQVALAIQIIIVGLKGLGVVPA